MVTLERRPTSNVIEYVKDQIVYKRGEILLWNDNLILAFYNNTLLNCLMDSLHCTLNHLVYIGTVEENYCSLMVNKLFTGYEVTTMQEH